MYKELHIESIKICRIYSSIISLNRANDKILFSEFLFPPKDDKNILTLIAHPFTPFPDEALQ
jgi:hypothetical protein